MTFVEEGLLLQRERGAIESCAQRVPHYAAGEAIHEPLDPLLVSSHGRLARCLGPGCLGSGCPVVCITHGVRVRLRGFAALRGLHERLRGRLLAFGLLPPALVLGEDVLGER